MSTSQWSPVMFLTRALHSYDICNSERCSGLQQSWLNVVMVCDVVDVALQLVPTGYLSKR